MNINELKEYWLSEENAAHISGWDFSHIDGRFISGEDRLPWDLTEVIKRYLRSSHRLLDIDTGGGEYLLSLGHPHELTSAAEGFPPNVELCRERLGALGIDVREMTDYSAMPFPDGYFDIITNRHGKYDAEELFRVLRPGGIFVTQQVGKNNDRELVEFLLPHAEKRFPGHSLTPELDNFRNAGFRILESGEAYRPVSFTDTGALVWFAHIIEWEFCGFSVEKCFDRLIAAEHVIQQKGCISGNIHRFMIAAQKPFPASTGNDH